MDNKNSDTEDVTSTVSLLNDHKNQAGIYTSDHLSNNKTGNDLQRRILMIAPEPFLEPRGTPFSVYARIKALVSLGYRVDLITYPVGERVRIPGLRVYRAPRFPFMRQVKVGPSLAKFPLDFFVFLMAIYRLCAMRYKYIHTHEEASIMGALLAPLFGCKHLYDMHSDLAEEITNFSFTKSRFLIRCVEELQKWVIRTSEVVIIVYPELMHMVKRVDPTKPVFLVINAPVDSDLPPPETQDIERLRNRLGVGNSPVLLYTGTLEHYQGIDLLLESITHMREIRPDARYVVVGGRPSQISRFQQHAQELGVADMVHFPGQCPRQEVPHYMALADVLLSPRDKGTNTPLKLYTYLRSGKPILATQIASHTQILDSDIAMLVPPTAEGLAQGALELLQNPDMASKLASNGQKVAEEKYSWEVFVEKNRLAYTKFTTGDR